MWIEIQNTGNYSFYAWGLSILNVSRGNSNSSNMNTAVSLRWQVTGGLVSHILSSHVTLTVCI